MTECLFPSTELICCNLLPSPDICMMGSLEGDEVTGGTSEVRLVLQRGHIMNIRPLIQKAGLGQAPDLLATLSALLTVRVPCGLKSHPVYGIFSSKLRQDSSNNLMHVRPAHSPAIWLQRALPPPFYCGFNSRLCYGLALP